MKVGALKTGDEIFSLKGSAKVTSIEADPTPKLAYNFEVQQHHNYQVGELGAEAHNGVIDKMEPIIGADGAHSVFKRGPPDKKGPIIGYETYEPNSRAPCGYSPKKRFRGSGKPHGGIQPPIITEGGRARPPEPWELPLGYK